MAKKQAKKSLKPKKISAAGSKGSQKGGLALPQGAPKLPPEVEKKLKAIKDKLDKFKDKVVEKFGDYIVGMTLLPPEKPKEGEKEKKPEEKLDIMVVVDDSTSQKMPKGELLKKFSTIVKEMAEQTDKKINPQCFLLSEVWQNSYDAKYDLNR